MFVCMYLCLFVTSAFSYPACRIQKVNQNEISGGFPIPMMQYSYPWYATIRKTQTLYVAFVPREDNWYFIKPEWWIAPSGIFGVCAYKVDASA